MENIMTPIPCNEEMSGRYNFHEQTSDSYACF